MDGCVWEKLYLRGKWKWEITRKNLQEGKVWLTLYGLLEKELEFRNITNIPIKISKGQVEAFVEETKQTMFDTILLMSCYSLRDAFGFGNKRLMDFKNKFSEYTESLSGGYMQWQEIAEQMTEETGIEFHIRSTDERLRC